MEVLTLQFVILQKYVTAHVVYFTSLSCKSHLRRSVDISIAIEITSIYNESTLNYNSHNAFP